MIASGIRKDIKTMKEKINVAVIELRKIFKGSIEYYDRPSEDFYTIEYCSHGLLLRYEISYNKIKETDITTLINDIQIYIATKIKDYFYK